MQARQRRLLLIALTTIIVASCAGGCSSSPARAANEITIRDFKFGSPLTVRAGTHVTVRNADNAIHTVTADDGSFNTGPIQPGGTATITLVTPRDEPFHCNLHPYMTGVIRVSH